MKRKIKYKTYYGKPYRSVSGRRHEMDNTTQQILWTALWLLFIFGLCILFNNAVPLWLLFIWLMGIM